MTTIDGFYDSTSGDRIYNSQTFSDFIEFTFGDGYIKGYNNQLEVTESSPVALSVDVDTGAAFAQGRWIEVTASETLTITTADATNPRIDRIIVRADESSGVRETSLVVLAGTPAASPTAPALTRTATIWELSLAQVLVGAGVTTISNANITDERDDTSLCGRTRARSFQPSARVKRTTNQTITTSTTTAVSFDSELHDNDNIHSTVTNPTRLTVNESGVYHIIGNVQWDSNATGRRFISIRLNGTTEIAANQMFAGTTGSLRQSINTMYKAAKGDYFEILVNQDSGGNLNIVANADVANHAEIVFVSAG